MTAAVLVEDSRRRHPGDAEMSAQAAMTSQLQVATLTERETEVLALLERHMTNAQIAESLFISVRTVESHVSSMLRKLGVPDRRSLARSTATTESSTPEPMTDEVVQSSCCGNDVNACTAGAVARRTRSASVRRRRRQRRLGRDQQRRSVTFTPESDSVSPVSASRVATATIMAPRPWPTAAENW
jgi:DNA-binding CsgD family transcriptional regulator